jgi:HD-like signal output (HDOD) protein
MTVTFRPSMSNSQPQPDNTAFDFVRALAGELSQGHVNLPSFPEVAVRVRRVLSNADSTVEQVFRAVGSEPALAARLLRIANSATFNRNGRPVADLRGAINRLGHNTVRTATLSFAMAQIRENNKLAGLESVLVALWQRTTAVAAFAYVLARDRTRVNPDEAMLTGMMHAIGKLYLLIRAADHPGLFAGLERYNGMIGEWHPAIGKAIMENWEFPDAMSQAVGEQERDDRTDAVAPDLRDILAIAIVMAHQCANSDGLVLALQNSPAAHRLRLDAEETLNIIRDSLAEVTALSQALGS